MNATLLQNETPWVDICATDELLPNLGARALINNQQVAIFRVQGVLFAISAIDPFSGAAVLSRGIVGDLKGQVVVASPLYKQHFNLQTGVCLEDPEVRVATFAVKEEAGRIWLTV